MAPQDPNPEAPKINLFDPQVSACPQPVYRRMLESCPVARTTMGGGAIIARGFKPIIWNYLL